MLPKNALVKAKKAVDGLMNLKCDIYEYSEITEDSITRSPFSTRVNMILSNLFAMAFST